MHTTSDPFIRDSIRRGLPITLFTHADSLEGIATYWVAREVIRSLNVVWCTHRDELSPALMQHRLKQASGQVCIMADFCYATQTVLGMAQASYEFLLLLPTGGTVDVIRELADSSDSIALGLPSPSIDAPTVQGNVVYYLNSTWKTVPNRVITLTTDNNRRVTVDRTRRFVTNDQDCGSKMLYCYLSSLGLVDTQTGVRIERLMQY